MQAAQEEVPGVTFLFVTFHDICWTEVAQPLRRKPDQGGAMLLAENVAQDLTTWTLSWSLSADCLHSGFKLCSLIWTKQSKLQELSTNTFQAQPSSSLKIHLECVHFFILSSIKYKNRNLGRSVSGLDKCSSSVRLRNSPALFLCSRVALTPGQHLKLGPGPVWSGRVYAFQSSSGRNGCSWRNCSSASGPFTGKRTHLLGLERVWPGRLRYVHAFIWILLITDGRR